MHDLLYAIKRKVQVHILNSLLALFSLVGYYEIVYEEATYKHVIIGLHLACNK